MAARIRFKRVALALIVPVLAIAAVAWYCGVIGLPRRYAPANSILVIAPYRYQGMWVFDDAGAGLEREPFVAGAPEMIELLVADIPDAEEGFLLLFSAQPFPGHQWKLTWVRGESGGNYYRLEDPPMEGWLCPAMFKYFREAPKELYVQAKPKG
jgi:hypothetical protein